MGRGPNSKSNQCGIQLSCRGDVGLFWQTIIYDFCESYRFRGTRYDAAILFNQFDDVLFAGSFVRIPQHASRIGQQQGPNCCRHYGIIRSNCGSINIVTVVWLLWSSTVQSACMAGRIAAACLYICANEKRTLRKSASFAGAG